MIRSLVFMLLCVGAIPVWGQQSLEEELTWFDQQSARLFQQGHYAAAVHVVERALTLAEQKVGRTHPLVARYVNNLAVAYERMGDYVTALRLHRRALKISEKVLGLNHPDTAIDLDNLALVYKLTGQYGKASPLYQRALTIREKVLGPHHPDTAASLHNLAALYSALGNYGKALPLQRRALAIQEQAFGVDHPNTASALNNLAVLHRNLGEYEKARRLYERALAIRERTLGPDHPDTATSLNNLADGFITMGEYEKARRLYERALAIRERTLGPDHPDTATSLNNLSQSFYRAGDYAKAVSLQQQALAALEKTLGPSHPNTARALTNLADTYKIIGEYAKALPLYQQAITIYEKNADPDQQETAAALDSLAGLYENMGDYTKAITLQQRALAIIEKAVSPEHPETATALNNLALLYHRTGEYAKALRLQRRALLIRERLFGPAHPDTATSLSNLARLYEQLGNYPRALTLQQRALAIKKKILGNEHTDTAASLNHLALLHHRTRDYAKARPLLEQVLTIREKRLGPVHPDTATALNNLAMLHMSLGQWQRALEYFTRGLAVEDQVFAHVFAVASETQKLQFAHASGYYHIALSLIHRHLAGDAAAVRFGLDLVLRRKGIVFDAQARAQKAQSTNLGGDALQSWQRLTRLRGDLSHLLLRGPEPYDPSDYQQRIVTLQTVIAREEELLAQHNGAAVQDLFQRQVAAHLVAARLPEDRVLVEFVRIRDWNEERNVWAETFRYLAFVLTPNNHVALADLGDAEKIERKVALTLTTINDPNFREDIQASAHAADERLAELYDVLLRPLEAALGPSCAWLIVSPDGELNKVPFPALRFPGRQGRYVVEQWTIAYAASGRDLLQGALQEPSTVDLLLVADPLFDDWREVSTAAHMSENSPARDRRRRFEPLPGAAEEARRISAFVKGTRRALVGAQATEAAVRSTPSPKILHFATHGFFLQDTEFQEPARFPSLSPISVPARTDASSLARTGLALAGANRMTGASAEDDGLLTALEISGLHLYGTELVVLSACETAVGEIRVGEGVYGLRRAFLLAGARNVVMSLWAVNDKITLAQMEEFYRAYEREASAPQALREAQLQTIATLRALTKAALGEALAPVQLWAPFIAQQTGEG